MQLTRLNAIQEGTAPSRTLAPRPRLPPCLSDRTEPSISLLPAQARTDRCSLATCLRTRPPAEAPIGTQLLLPVSHPSRARDCSRSSAQRPPPRPLSDQAPFRPRQQTITHPLPGVLRTRTTIRNPLCATTNLEQRPPPPPFFVLEKARASRNSPPLPLPSPLPARPATITDPACRRPSCSPVLVRFPNRSHCTAASRWTTTWLRARRARLRPVTCLAWPMACRTDLVLSEATTAACTWCVARASLYLESDPCGSSN